MKRRNTDTNFQKLAAQINNAIIQNEGLIGDQKAQVELLMQMEAKFKHSLLKYKELHDIYEKFIDYVVLESGNILSASPYFREPVKVFRSGISRAIKERDVKSLMKYRINFKLIKFIVDRWSGALPERASRYYNEVIEARRILIENNLPLAINRAKLFYRKTSRSHLSILDLIDICTYGLITGIDKYSNNHYTKVWVSVCIGFMTGYMIEEYSKTFIRMFPSEKKILYRTNALRHRMKIECVKELTKAVNDSFQKDLEEGKKAPKLPISEYQIKSLLNASSYVSADSKSGGEDDDDSNGVSVYDYTPDESVENTETAIIEKNLMSNVIDAAKGLSVIERKIIRLHGVMI